MKNKLNTKIRNLWLITISFFVYSDFFVEFTIISQFYNKENSNSSESKNHLAKEILQIILKKSQASEMKIIGMLFHELSYMLT